MRATIAENYLNLSTDQACFSGAGFLEAGFIVGGNRGAGLSVGGSRDAGFIRGGILSA